MAGGITRSVSIPQANIFGRVGTGIGQGLAEQLPKEIERGRLAQGLGELSQQQGLTPFQQFSRLAALPGITPQMLQSGAELLRYQNQANAYAKASGGNVRGSQLPATGQSPSQQPDRGSINPKNYRETEQLPGGVAQSLNRTPNVSSKEDINGIVNEPQLNDRALTRTPWSPQQRNQSISDYINQGFLPDQARELQADDEARDLAEPGALQQRNEQLKGKSAEAKGELQRQLETKLQKKDQELYADITGDMLIAAQRGMERDLRADPNSSYENVANDWSNRLLEVAKAKKQFTKTAKTTGIESIWKGDKALNKYKAYSDIFKRAGNSQEYYNMLIKDAELSPQGAALIAYGLSKGAQNYVDKYRPENISHKKYGYDKQINSETNARKVATQIGEYINTNDSILAIARSLSEKDPFFDQEAFFDQIRQDQDQMSLNDRQRLEIAEGEKDITPTWGDIKIFPWFRRTPL